MNNNKPSSIKTYLIIGVVIFIAIAGYFYWNGTKITSDTLNETNGSDEIVGARVLSLLNQINSLKIDTSFFDEPVYTTLQDYTVQVPELPVGRPNPFAPISGVSTSTTRR